MQAPPVKRGFFISSGQTINKTFKSGTKNVKATIHINSKQSIRILAFTTQGNFITNNHE